MTLERVDSDTRDNVKNQNKTITVSQEQEVSSSFLAKAQVGLRSSAGQSVRAG